MFNLLKLMSESRGLITMSLVLFQTNENNQFQMNDRNSLRHRHKRKTKPPSGDAQQELEPTYFAKHGDFRYSFPKRPRGRKKSRSAPHKKAKAKRIHDR